MENIEVLAESLVFEKNFEFVLILSFNKASSFGPRMSSFYTKNEFIFYHDKMFD